MRKAKMILLTSLLCLPGFVDAQVKDSDEVELIVGVKKEFFVGAFPPEVKMSIDPFRNQHDFKNIQIPVRWDVDHSISITGKLTCSKGDEALCDRLFVVGNYPHKYYETFGLIFLDKSQEPVTAKLTDFNKKVDNPKWKWNFGVWGSLTNALEARTYKAKLDVTIEADV